MTRALVTVRNGDIATYIHDVDMATLWIQTLGAATLLKSPAMEPTLRGAGRPPDFSPTSGSAATVASPFGHPLMHCVHHQCHTDLLKSTACGHPSMHCVPDQCHTDLPKATPSLDVTPTVEATSGSADLESDIEHRLSIVERALRVQMALGATHLQQV